jgi:phage terminase large subunit
MEIEVPVDWEPRGYQLPMWKFLERGGKRAVAIWHRRAGKDATSLNFTVVQAVQRPGLYWHLLPTYNQGRKIVWDGRTKEGRPFLDAWPKDLITGINSTDMKLELSNGSIWQVVGTDNVDRLVGANPIGCVFSEYSLQDPRAWDYIRPILAENGGWAIFIYTPRGRNHGYALYNMARNNPNWHCELLGIDDTKVLTEAIIEEERKAGMPEEMIQQEFYCSFDAGLVGAYYSNQMSYLLQEKRLTKVPYEPRLEVHTAWDIGVGDSTAVGFVQVHGEEIRMIDYYENSGEGMLHYIKVLRDKPYLYGKHFGPPDLEVREFTSGKSRKDVAAQFGLKFTIVPKLAVEEGIEMVRNMLPKTYWDEEKCSRWIEALRQYKKEWDDKRRVFSSNPVHDWTSHPADMTRYLAVGLNPKRQKRIVLPRSVGLDYNPLGY